MIAETITQTYFTRRLSKTNLHDLYILYKAVYKAERPIGYFEKKYDTVYTGCTNIGFIAYNHQKEPISFYGVQPCLIRYKEKIYLAAQSGDTMTHPHYRFQGLFIELSKITFLLAKQEGIHFLFGFPNQNSYPGMIKHLNWQLTDYLQCFTWKINTLPIAHKKLQNRRIKKRYQWYVRFVLKRFCCLNPGLPNSLLKEGFAGIERKNDYLEYKKYSKTYVLQLNKAKAWISVRDAMLIGDVELNGEQVKTVIQKLKYICFMLGIPRMYFQTSTNTYLSSLLEEYYKGEETFPVLFQDLSGSVSFKDIKFTLADIDIF